MTRRRGLERCIRGSAKATLKEENNRSSRKLPDSAGVRNKKSSGPLTDISVPSRKAGGTALVAPPAKRSKVPNKKA